MRLKTLAGTAASAAAIVLSAFPAAAAGTVTVTPQNITADGQVVTVTWSGFTAPTFLAQCSKSITAADFNPDIYCDNDTNGGVVNGPFAGTAQVTTFKGDRDLFGWACGSTVSGLPVSNPCYIRIAQGGSGNLDGDVEIPITYVQEVVPEVPYSVLLPMGAIAAIGTGIFLNRRRMAAA